MVEDIRQIKECPDCASPNIVHNIRKDQVICRECGLIYEPLSPLEDVVPGNKIIDMKKLRKLTKAKNIRLATAEEVINTTACEPGSVPPFGSLFNIPVYADKNLAEEMDFNAGLHEVSITINRSDWEKVVKPIIVDIAGERAVS